MTADHKANLTACHDCHGTGQLATGGGTERHDPPLYGLCISTCGHCGGTGKERELPKLPPEVAAKMRGGMEAFVARHAAKSGWSR